MTNKKQPLCSHRVRKITGSFAFIEHRFLRDGFWDSLDHHELLLYVFLVLVADRNGLSYYSYDKICSTLRVFADQYAEARNSLIEKDLIAFDGHLYQVLSLPEKPRSLLCSPSNPRAQKRQSDPVPIQKLIARFLGEQHDHSQRHSRLIRTDGSKITSPE